MSRHIKLPKSSVKDSFKEIALEKKWINPEQIEKKASITDLSLTDSLDANISKLIIGLKDSNLDKFAEEIRYHFLNYKKAENDLYNVTKNEYSKYINLAHPKGSHKMENMEGDAVIEDLYDTQNAILNLLKDKKNFNNLKNIKASENDSKEVENLKSTIIKNINNLQSAIEKSSIDEKNAILNLIYPLINLIKEIPIDLSKIDLFRRIVTNAYRNIAENFQKAYSHFTTDSASIKDFMVRIEKSINFNITNLLVIANKKEKELYLTEEEKENNLEEEKSQNVREKINKIEKQNLIRSLYDDADKYIKELTNIAGFYNKNEINDLYEYINDAKNKISNIYDEYLKKSEYSNSKEIDNIINEFKEKFDPIISDIKETIREWK